ncbi:MAG: zf-HC2 domain-containing protein [Gemmatimonadota bacterium]|nr:MAG: zf-HC2 domain-containing protein [Gemmatimonadota bacterium]
MSSSDICEVIGSGDVISRYVTDGLPPNEVEAFEAHLLTCEYCQTEVRLALALQEELMRSLPARNRVPVAVRSTGRRWIAGVGTAVAAAAAVWLVVAYPQGAANTQGTDVHRAPSGSDVSTVTVAPAPLSPVGPTTRPTDLVWSRVLGADRYRASLLDSAGDLMWESETVDTTARLPSALKLTPGDRYFWKVDARVDFDRWLKSDVVEFSPMPEPDLADPTDELPG